jgi:hypothetical protein
LPEILLWWAYPKVTPKVYPLPFVRPSPPPWGWSTGFIATPRTMGRLPNHLCPPFRCLCAPD